MSFREIVGHGPLLQLLARTVGRKAVPASLIFSGPDGVGKRMIAVALAQALNCERPEPWGDVDDPGLTACGTCSSCRRVARGVHADVLRLEPGDTGAIKVDQVREAIDRAAYRPFEGKRRVVIIDSADALLPEAQNALLKTLEEPPPASMFVLVTSRPDVLLPTVRSRCQQLRFGPLSEADVARALIERHDVSPTEAHAAAAAADGSIGAALDGGGEKAVEAREAAASALQQAAASTDPRRRLDAARTLGSAGERSGRHGASIARAVLIASRSWTSAFPRGRPRARQRRPEAAAAAAPQIVRQRSRDSRVFGGGPRACGARAKRQPEDCGGLGGTPAVRVDRRHRLRRRPGSAVWFGRIDEGTA